MALEILHPEQGAAWLQVLQRCVQYDFYYLPEYHHLAEERGEGQARLFVYQDGKYLIAVPLLLRPLDTIAGLEQAGVGWWDATSVYGYAGPILSDPCMPAAVLHDFRTALQNTLHEQRVVSVFSRMHPLIAGQSDVLQGIGEYLVRWQTVSIDLRLTPEAQLAQYRQGHRYDIRRLQRIGVECIHDQGYEYLDEFMRIYHETMQRVDATASYFFDNRYFKQLTEQTSMMNLFICRMEGRVICGALVGLCNGIAQYHLAGTANEALRLAPMKLLLDQVRGWATQQGAYVLHLGGGLGSAEDSLFQFKAGFSDQRHDFAIWRWMLRPDICDRLSDTREQTNLRQGLRMRASDFFPQYRCPTVPISSHDLKTTGKD